ncbi:MAG: FixH family protein [Rhodospirillaceae bacterium]
MRDPARRPRKLTGRHVLMVVVGFFAVIFAVNGVFLYLSLSTHPGVSTGDAYRKGLHFNRELDAGDRQRALGWQAEISHDDGVVTLRLRQSGGAPLAGVAVALEARRPATAADDRTLSVDEVAPGVFRAAGPPLAAGRWMLVGNVSDPDGHRFRSETEILVQP